MSIGIKNIRIFFFEKKIVRRHICICVAQLFLRSSSPLLNHTTGSSILTPRVWHRLLSLVLEGLLFLGELCCMEGLLPPRLPRLVLGSIQHCCITTGTTGTTGPNLFPLTSSTGEKMLPGKPERSPHCHHWPPPASRPSRMIPTGGRIVSKSLKKRNDFRNLEELLRKG